MVCKNCENLLVEDQKFCSECGARVINNRLTLKALFYQINEEFFSVDNKLLKTFIHLFTKPEVVIVSFIEGTRKRYINVIQYLAVALTLLGLQVFLMETAFDDPNLYATKLFEEIAKQPGQEYNPIFNPNSKFSDFNSFQSLFFTISIPFSALATWLAFWIGGFRQFNFTEHVVINIYYGAQVTIFSAIIYIVTLSLSVNFFTTTTVITFLYLLYFFYVLKRVFKLNLLLAFVMFLLSIMALSFVFIIVFLLSTIVAFIYVLLNKAKFSGAI